MPGDKIIQIRRDTTANWITVNPILADGEVGLETDTRKTKYGDGITLWTSLAYADAAILENIAATYATIEFLEAEYATIVNLNATNAVIETLDVTYATIENLEADYATIANLTATNANITNLSATYATIINLTATNATITNLSATYATITNLTATNANIGSLVADVATINNVLAGNVGADNIQAGAIQAGSLVIATGAIASAQIIDLDVAKLNAGNISTNKFVVQSDSGNLKIQNNTLHVWDNAGKERVSLGLNGSDYNLLIRGTDGTTVLFGTDGVTHAGITTGAVDDSNVAENANINGSKMDIHSLVTEINGSTTLLKSSHILYDPTAQTFEVAFGELKGTVTAQGTNLTNNYSTTSQTATLLSSKVTQTQVDASINAIQVGGRNLLRNGDFVTTWIGAGSGVNTIEVDSFFGNVLKTNYNYVYSQNISNGTIRTGDTVTVSFYAKGEDLPNASFFLTDLGAVRPISIVKGFSLATEWTKKEITFIASHDADGTQVLLFYPGGDITKMMYIAKVKIEKGNKATDWTPAPEDVQGQIDATNTNIRTNYSTIDQTATNIGLAVTGINTNLSTNYSTTAAMNSAIEIKKDSIISTVSKTIAESTAVNTQRYYSDSDILYSGTWTLMGGSGDKSMLSTITANYFQFPFVGTGIKLYFVAGGGKGICTIYIDGVSKGDIDTYYATTMYDRLLYTNTTLAYGNHVVKVVVKGTKNASSVGYGIDFTSATTTNAQVVNSTNVLSQIYQSAEEVKIQATKISLEGLVTVNNGFKIMTDGSMEAVNGKFTGGAISIGQPGCDSSYSVEIIGGDFGGVINFVDDATSLAMSYLYYANTTAGLIIGSKITIQGAIVAVNSTNTPIFQVSTSLNQMGFFSHALAGQQGFNVYGATPTAAGIVAALKNLGLFY